MAQEALTLRRGPGVRSGELRPGTDPRETASVVVATLGGAVMLSRLYDDPAYMNRSVDHLKEQLSSLARGHERSLRVSG